jgi:hypothetical protein
MSRPSLTYEELAHHLGHPGRDLVGGRSHLGDASGVAQHVVIADDVGDARPAWSHVVIDEVDACERLLRAAGEVAVVRVDD